MTSDKFVTQAELDSLTYDTYIDCGLNAAAAAHQLGISATTVRRRVRRHVLSRYSS